MIDTIPTRYVAWHIATEQWVETGPIEGARYYILPDPDVPGGRLCVLTSPKREAKLVGHLNGVPLYGESLPQHKGG